MPRIIGRPVALWLPAPLLVVLVVLAVVLDGGPAGATQGQPVNAGQFNSEDTTTTLSLTIPQGTSTSNIPGLEVDDPPADNNHTPVAILGSSTGTASGTGVLGSSSAGTGVDGSSSSGNGVAGRTSGSGSASGVFGHNTGDGNGVYGKTASDAASGVYGENDGKGFGLAGRAVKGTGVLADSENGTALDVEGKFVSNRSGVATVDPGHASVTVFLGHLSPATFVVATVKGNPSGIWVRSAAVFPGGSFPYFKIFLNKAPGQTVKVGWFALN